MIAFNDQAVRKAIKDGEGKSRGEWRIAGVDRLVLMTHPTGAGTFFVFYTATSGQRRKLKLGEYHPDAFTLREARTRALDALAAINRGLDPVAEAEARANEMTFKELAEKFLTENPDIATTTRRVYRYCLEKDAYPDDICKRIEASGARVQSERTKTTIGGIYRWAMRQRLVKANPCAGIGRRSPKVARTRTPSDAELATLWAAVEGQSGKPSQSMRLIIQLAILTGQRRTEVAGAHRSELHGLETDLPTWVIPGDENNRGKIIEGRTKNGREQHVPLSRQSTELFGKALALSKDKEFVFPADISKVKIGQAPRTAHINGDSVTMAVRRLRATAGVGDISIHDMRRAISNWLKNEGFSREVRDLILNHKDPSVTEAHYSSTARMEKQVRAALQAWADHIWKITGQSEQALNVLPMPSRARETA